MFATEKDMNAAQTKPILYNNFRVYWINEEKTEMRKRENHKVERGRSWDRFSQTTDAEEDKSNKERQRNKTYVNRNRYRRGIGHGIISQKERNKSQNRYERNQERDTNTKNRKEKNHERETEEAKTQKQENESHIKNFLEQI
jgi:hypothetical protein